MTHYHGMVFQRKMVCNNGFNIVTKDSQAWWCQSDLQSKLQDIKRYADPVSKTRQIPFYYRVNGGSPGFHFPLPARFYFLVWVEWEVNKGGTWEIGKRPISVPFLVFTFVYSRTPVIWSCAGDLWIVSWTLFKFVCMCAHKCRCPKRYRILGGWATGSSEQLAIGAELNSWILYKSCTWSVAPAPPPSFLKMPVELHNGWHTI